MKEIDLKEERVFYNILKRIYVAAKEGYANSKEILAIPIVKCDESHKWFKVGSRMISYRKQDLIPVESTFKRHWHVGNAA